MTPVSTLGVRDVLLPFSLVDVFASEPLSGNGLSVFLLNTSLSTSAMQRITQELRQFETIFLQPTADTRSFAARIFTMEEELSFAGHPLIGAAACLHAAQFANEPDIAWQLQLGERSVTVRSQKSGQSYFSEMQQGVARFGPAFSLSDEAGLLSALNLDRGDLAHGLPMQVVSTGLPYLIVPLSGNLARAQIVDRDFEAKLARVGAKFVYVLDVANREGRTWDNAGRVEDIATGSAAGPAAAYLVQHGLAASGERLVLRQGRFVDRASELHALVTGTTELSVSVGGQVCLVGNGELRLPSRLLQHQG